MVFEKEKKYGYNERGQKIQGFAVFYLQNGKA